MDHLRTSSPVGVDYLDAVTRLLHRRRLTDPEGTMWEAADLQWWWTRDPHDDRDDALFWSDPDGPIAGVTFTHWAPDHVGCEVIAEANFAPAWRFAAQRSSELGEARIEINLVLESDAAIQNAARAIGLGPSHETFAVSWLDPAVRREPSRPLPPGYRIISRSEDALRPHPMIARNGEHIESRLRHCSLYDSDLDLAVLAPDHSVAGYALFWADPVTRIGLVEPMRVEDNHAGRGLGTHLLNQGLSTLAQKGCTRLKVTPNPEDPVAQKLYSRAGFVSSELGRAWVRNPPPQPGGAVDRPASP